jgi:hypothetical protein
MSSDFLLLLQVSWLAYPWTLHMEIWNAESVRVTQRHNSETVLYTVLMLFCIRDSPNLKRQLVHDEEFRKNLNCNIGRVPVVIDSTMHKLSTLLAPSTACFSKSFLLFSFAYSFCRLARFPFHLKRKKFYRELSSQIANSEKNPFLLNLKFYWSLLRKTGVTIL